MTRRGKVDAAVLALGPCDEAAEWLRSAEGSPADVWRKCERGDWMLWLAEKAAVDMRLVRRAAVGCARLSLDNVGHDDLLAVLLCLHVTDEWCDGRADAADLAAAASVAWSVWGAGWSAAESAADSAVRSTVEAAESAASNAVRSAAESAAFAATSAARSAAESTAYNAALVDCANVVRQHISAADVVGALLARRG